MYYRGRNSIPPSAFNVFKKGESLYFLPFCKILLQKNHIEKKKNLFCKNRKKEGKYGNQNHHPSCVGGPKKQFYPGQKVETYVNPNNILEYYVPDDSVKAVIRIFGMVGVLLIIASAVVAGTALH